MMTRFRWCLSFLLVWSIIFLAAAPVIAPARIDAAKSRDRKILFISGLAFWIPFAYEQVDPVPGWDSIKNFLKANNLTDNLDLQDDDFLYFSYSGEYETTPTGKKNYARPIYQRIHTSLRFANYDSRASVISEILNAYPDTTFDIIGHSLGGVVATYWAASRPIIVGVPDPLLNRVNSIITIDSPLRGHGDFCNVVQWPFATEIPDVVVKALPNAVKRVSILTIRNKSDKVVEPRNATLDGVWRDLEEYLGTGIPDVCGEEAHGEPLKHLSAHLEIAMAMLSGKIIKPTRSAPALAGSATRPDVIKLLIGDPLRYPGERFDKSNFRVKIGGKTAEIVNLRDSTLPHAKEAEVKPPPQSAGGLYDLMIEYDRGLLGTQTDTLTGTVQYAGIGAPVPVAGTATILVLDVSGSMGESWRGGVKIESAKEAAQRFLSMLEAESKAGEVSHQVAIVTFSSDAYLNLVLTMDYARAKAIIAGLQPTAQTNIGAALQKANEALRQASGNPRKIIVLLTDGMTNTGLPREQVLSGPVAEATQAGTCIYTIGFGEASNLDEAFLKQVAQASRCGQYYYGAAGFELQNLYIKVRHESTGNIIGEFAGQVRQGETVTAGQVEVKPWQQELRATLNWPGSKLDLVLTDPRGRRLDGNYPGITVFAEGPLVYIIVKEPLAGFWQIAVTGQEVPGSGTEYRVIVSTVQGKPNVIVQPALVAFLGLMMLLVLAVVVGIAVSRRPAYGPPTPVARGAGLRVLDGPLAGTFVPFRGGMLTIGRAPGHTLILPDPQVSHTHAHIVAVTGGLAIYDRNSRNGTFINGQRVPAASLRPGDEIRVGNTRLRFEVYG